jgi:hypothetical protein
MPAASIHKVISVTADLCAGVRYRRQSPSAVSLKGGSRQASHRATAIAPMLIRTPTKPALSGYQSFIIAGNCRHD